MSLDDRIQAIKPEEIDNLKKEYLLQKAHQIPKQIIEIFNTLIVEKYHSGTAVVSQPDVVKRIMDIMKVDHNEIFNKGWLDVELVFEEAGWKVSYDKPAYNETYDASWTFNKK